MVTHDRRISGAKCRDTGPATPGDPEYPYVGDYVNTLTLAQVRTLDCGSQRLAAYPEQELAPGEPMPLLSEVFDLVRAYNARQVMLNIETKVEPAHRRRRRLASSSCASPPVSCARPGWRGR